MLVIFLVVEFVVDGVQSGCAMGSTLSMQAGSFSNTANHWQFK
eukprot:SAG31_NODE_151_length_22216_cov_37.572139_4_plen_43_part_00